MTNPNAFYLFYFSYLLLSSLRLMGIDSLSPPTKPPSLHHNHHQGHHYLGIRATDTLLIFVILIISIVILFAVFLSLVLYRRYRSTKRNLGRATCNNINTTRITATTTTAKFGSGTTTTTTKFGSGRVTTTTFNSSPDVRNCLYGGNLGRTPSAKFRGGQVFTYKELEMATEKFSEANEIGNGGFGVVYRGTLSNGTVAAIKMLNRQGKQGEREFRVEVDLLSRLHSPYLLELLGYCADQHHRLLIFEFQANGNLQSHLHPSTTNRQCRPLDWGTRLRIALDCARGLEFLHERTVPAIIHRDFKSSNILLDDHYRAKVSDFGLAKMGSDKINGQISTRVLGTAGYVAPEYASSGKLTTKSDVYSYGVVLLELLTGRVPIDSKRPPGEHVLVSWALPRLTNREKVEEMVDPALQGQYSKKELIQIAAIAAVCVQSEADYRPLMTDVVQSLIPLVRTHTRTGLTTTSNSQYQTVIPIS